MPACIHPGEILLTEVFVPANLSVRAAAERLEIEPGLLASVVSGDLPVTTELASALAREFGHSRARWVALQREWDRERMLS